MYNIFHNSATLYMFEHVPRFIPTHCARRSQNSFIVTHVKSNGSVTFKYNAVKIWNSLPNLIKNCETKDKFKLNCKKHLLRLMQEMETDDFIRY